MGETVKTKDPVTVSAEELRVNLANYLGRVMYADEMIVVKKYNRDAAIILSPRMFKRLIDSAQATPEDRATALRELDALVSKIPDSGLSEEQLEALIDQEVKAVRAQRAARAQKR